MSNPKIWLKVVFTGRSWKIGILMTVAKLLGVEFEYYAGGGAQMRTRMVEERIGEYLGPVDWSYDFSKGVASMCCGAQGKAERLTRYVELLWEVERRHLRKENFSVSTSGYYHELLTVGMYDGWPYWKPTPALCVMGPLGPTWDFYYELDGVRGRAMMDELLNRRG